MTVQVIIDAERMNEKEESHKYLKECFGFPEYYGGNLDALYDCLTELDDTEVVITGMENSGKYFGQIYKILRLASEDNEYLRIS